MLLVVAITYVGPSCKCHEIKHYSEYVQFYYLLAVKSVKESALPVYYFCFDFIINILLITNHHRTAK